MTIRKKWDSPMNKAALVGALVAAVMASVVCFVFYSINGGIWNWWVFLGLFALAWGVAINNALRNRASENTSRTER